jgi:mannose-1-phosphate guanylyltransferase/mannose-6-phosphate isomerase
MQNNIYGMILAGGSGSRLWPLSRELYPKQFLSFSDDKSLIQLTYERLTKFAAPENIITVTNKDQAPLVNSQLSELAGEVGKNALGEPCARNTAPAIALGMYLIKQKSGDTDPVIIVAPSDHLIKDTDTFRKNALQGTEIARQGYIVTFGIKPSCPETGYGYIKADLSKKVGETGVLAEGFREKPDYDTAVKYVGSGDYFWNGGIFMFTLSTMTEEFKKNAPEILEIINNIDLNDNSSLEENYAKLPSISIDYAVMEKSSRIVVIPAEFDWNDLGSWEAIHEVSGKDDRNNLVKGDVHTIDCQNSIIYSSSRHISAIGVKDLIIVETDDAVLVCDRRDSQRVKEAFDALKKKGSPLYRVRSAT